MNEFRTSDTQLASYLVAVGHSLRGIEGPRTRREFIFDAQAKADSMRYFTDTAHPIPPRKLFSAYRDLKSALFAGV